MRVRVIIIALLALGSLAGCQADLTGPSMSYKVLYKGENNNQEHLSRGSGMTSGTGYGSGVMSWGTFGKEAKRD